MDISVVANAVGFAGFAVGVAILSFVPSRAKSRFNAATKGFTIAAMLVYVLSLGIDLAAPAAVAGFVEELEDFIEVLFPILALMAVVSGVSGQQVADLDRAQRAMAASQDFTLSIIDAAPAGILLLDGTSAIAFANETARDTLDLREDPETGEITRPSWTVRDPRGNESDDLRCLLEYVGQSQRIVVEWANGWRVELLVSTKPLSEEAGSQGGVVATFERPLK